MIKRIYVSELDRHNLSKYKTIEGEARDKFNYRNLIVKKPWGYEYLLFENDYVAVWILHLKKGQATSVHCHPGKKSSLVVLSGKVQSSTLSEWFDLEVLDGLIIENGVFHSTKALSKEVFVMEIETPPNKKDLVRLKDSYGREGKGYEGKNMMSKEIHKFKHVFFDKNAIKNQKTKRINDVQLQINCCEGTILEKAVKNSKNKKVYCILEEKIIEARHKELFGVGNVFMYEHMLQYQNIRMYNNSLLLSLEYTG